MQFLSIKRVAWLGLLGLLMAAAAWADSWLPPRPQTFVSPNGAWRLTVQPREISSPLAYFEDKVADRPNAGGVPGSNQASAIGHMEHRENGRWRTAWKQPLFNEVSPVDALALDGGWAVTFDNWHSVGHGKNAIAIYDENGNLVRAFGLEDFLPAEYIHALPHSVSSIHWRGEPRISGDGRQLIVPVVVPSIDREEAPVEAVAHVDVRFLLATGQQVADAGPAWAAALASARQVYQKQKEEIAAAKTRFISPLRAPTTEEEPDWHGYLVEAFFRLDADWDDGYPATEVIPLPEDKDFDRSVGFLRDALADDMNADGVIMIASPSQDVLVNVLTKEFARVKADALAKARVYVAVDGAHVHTIRSALAHTGATFIQIDPDQGIPQRKERLDRHLNQAEDEE